MIPRSGFPSKVGYLEKQGVLWTAWRRRHFVLKDGYLYYYKNPEGEVAGNIPIGPGWKVITGPVDKGKFLFEIKPPNNSRSYHCAAWGESERRLWVQDITETIRMFSEIESSQGAAKVHSQIKVQNVDLKTNQQENSQQQQSQQQQSQQQQQQQYQQYQQQQSQQSQQQQPQQQQQQYQQQQSQQSQQQQQSQQSQQQKPERPERSQQKQQEIQLSVITNKSENNQVNTEKKSSYEQPPLFPLVKVFPRKIIKSFNLFVYAILLSIGYLIVGTLLFSDIEDWDYEKALYFTFFTLTAVGFGDLHPTTQHNRIIVAIFAVVGFLLTILFFTALQKRVCERVLRFKGSRLTKKRLYGSIFAYILVIAGGAKAFHDLESWSWLDSVYFCVSTASTIGYGDFVPTSNLSRGIAVLFSALTIFVFALMVSYFQERIFGRDLEQLLSEFNERSDGKKSTSKEFKSFIWLSIFLILFLGSASYLLVYFNEMSFHNVNIENLNWFDATYFIASSFSLIGFGDFVPSSDNSKIVVIGFTILLLLFCATSLRTIQLLISSLAINSGKEKENHKSATTIFFPNRYFVLPSVGLVVHFIVGAALFGYLENWEVLDSIYFAATATTTVGFGDIYPVTEIGKITFIPYCLIGMFFIGYLFAAISAKERHQLILWNIEFESL